MANVTKVPFLDLVTPHQELEAELLAVVKKAFSTAGFIGGPMVEDFEREFAAFCDAKYCVGVNSGTDALRFAFMGCRCGSRRHHCYRSPHVYRDNGSNLPGGRDRSLSSTYTNRATRWIRGNCANTSRGAASSTSKSGKLIERSRSGAWPESFPSISTDRPRRWIQFSNWRRNTIFL